MNANVAIQVLPKVDNDEEVIRIVDEVIAYIKSTGLNYFVGPCETSIEGDYDELMDIIKECQKIAVRAGAKSVSAYVKINYRPEGEVLTIEKKVTKHHIQNMVGFRNCLNIDYVADDLFTGTGRQLYAAIPN